MFEEQDTIVELRGMQQRLERLIDRLANQSQDYWHLSGQLRSLTGICETLLRLWEMSEEEVARQHLMSVYENPKDKMLGLSFHQLKLIMANDLKKEKSCE